MLLLLLLVGELLFGEEMLLVEVLGVDRRRGRVLGRLGLGHGGRLAGKGGERGVRAPFGPPNSL